MGLHAVQICRIAIATFTESDDGAHSDMKLTYCMFRCCQFIGKECMCERALTVYCFQTQQCQKYHQEFFYKLLYIYMTFHDIYISSFLEYFRLGRMSSLSGIQKTLMKSNRFLYPQLTCGFLTSSSMSCKSCCHYFFSSIIPPGVVPVFLWSLAELMLLFLCQTCSVDVGKSPDIPYVYVSHDGLVRNYKPIQVVTACTLNIYNFPFDVQKCSLTFQSWLHTSKTSFT